MLQKIFGDNKVYTFMLTKCLVMGWGKISIWSWFKRLCVKIKSRYNVHLKAVKSLALREANLLLYKFKIFYSKCGNFCPKIFSGFLVFKMFGSFLFLDYWSSLSGMFGYSVPSLGLFCFWIGWTYAIHCCPFHFIGSIFIFLYILV